MKTLGGMKANYWGLYTTLIPPGICATADYVTMRDLLGMYRSGYPPINSAYNHCIIFCDYDVSTVLRIADKSLIFHCSSVFD